MLSLDDTLDTFDEKDDTFDEKEIIYRLQHIKIINSDFYYNKDFK